MLERLARRALAQLALRHPLPSVFGTKHNAVAGGLMSYAPDALDLNRRAAVYVDKSSATYPRTRYTELRPIPSLRAMSDGPTPCPANAFT